MDYKRMEHIIVVIVAACLTTHINKSTKDLYQLVVPSTNYLHVLRNFTKEISFKTLFLGHEVVIQTIDSAKKSALLNENKCPISAYIATLLQILFLNTLVLVYYGTEYAQSSLLYTLSIHHQYLVEYDINHGLKLIHSSSWFPSVQLKDLM